MESIRLIEKLTGKQAHLEHKPLHPADVLATWADIGKARQLMGWEPRTSFEEGITRLVEWYNKNREWASQVDTR